MTKEAYIDIARQVGMEGDPCLTVAPDPDSPSDWVRLYAASPEAKEHWGKIDFSMPREMAEKLGEALIAAARG